MNWQNSPTGIIRRDDFLNIILALWKTRVGIIVIKNDDEFSQGREIGFEEGLDAIAQAVGLTEEFEAGKFAHRKIMINLDPKMNLVDGKATIVDTNQNSIVTKILGNQRDSSDNSIVEAS